MLVRYVSTLSYKPRVGVCSLNGRTSIGSLTLVLVARCSRRRCGNERSRTQRVVAMGASNLMAAVACCLVAGCGVVVEPGLATPLGSAERAPKPVCTMQLRTAGTPASDPGSHREESCEGRFRPAARSPINGPTPACPLRRAPHHRTSCRTRSSSAGPGRCRIVWAWKGG